jgi:hypothetical protein
MRNLLPGSAHGFGAAATVVLRACVAVVALCRRIMLLLGAVGERFPEPVRGAVVRVVGGADGVVEFLSGTVDAIAADLQAVVEQQLRQ